MSARGTQAGALVAGVVFGLVSDRAKFVISAVCGAVGMAITMLFVPDISGLDLSEGWSRARLPPMPTEHMLSLEGLPSPDPWHFHDEH